MAYSKPFILLHFSYVFSSIFDIVSAGPCNFNVKVKQNLLNDGFHRNITYGIVFNVDDDRDKWLYYDCILGLDQTLPRGVFANPDELGDFKRMGKLNAIPKNRINVELPAEDSEPSSVYLIGKVTASQVYLWLPVHARYHRAAPGGGSARNEIPAPKLYLRCPDERLEACDHQISPAVTFLCNGSSKEKCSWKAIPYTMMTKGLVWQVPVGDTNNYFVVASGTAAVVVLGAIYLLNSIHEYKIKKKYN